jgi:diguanylate cyclase (GGDEF)-like protein
LREYDLLARIGGEEFAILLSEMALQQGVETAERLRRAIEIMHESGTRASPPITISIGLADQRADEDLDGLMSRADRALYNAKRAGRNRCVVANGDSEA